MKRIATETKEKNKNKNEKNTLPPRLIIVKHFTLLKVMGKYMNLEGLAKEFPVLDKNQITKQYLMCQL